jgi:hypothetical protein
MPYHLRRRDDDIWEAFDRLDAAFEYEALLATPDAVIRLDLSQVTGVSSGGLQRLMQLLRGASAAGRSVRMTACPVDLVDAFNNIASMGVPYVDFVESFLAPYECTHCLKDRMVLLSTAEAMGRKVREVPPARRCSSCGSPLTFPIEAAEYFSFLGQ